MLRFEGKKAIRSCDGLTRRDFLRVGALSAGGVGLSLNQVLHAAEARGGETNCIFLFLVGGPSQLDTWDLKPAAPEHIRGPFRPIRNVPGIEICEHFPRMAQIADRYALVRSVHHSEPPVHERTAIAADRPCISRRSGASALLPCCPTCTGRESGVPPCVVVPAHWQHRCQCQPRANRRLFGRPASTRVADLMGVLPRWERRLTTHNVPSMRHSTGRIPTARPPQRTIKCFRRERNRRLY